MEDDALVVVLRTLVDEIRQLRADMMVLAYRALPPPVVTHPPMPIPIPLAPSDWPPGPQPTCVLGISDARAGCGLYQKPDLRRSASVHDSTIIDER